MPSPAQRVLGALCFILMLVSCSSHDRRWVYRYEPGNSGYRSTAKPSPLQGYPEESWPP